MSRLILLVEDNPADQHLVHLAFRRCNVEAELDTVSDGQYALEYLHRQGEYETYKKKPLPDLILLDINMPRLDGKQFLKLLKSNPKLSSIPVVILSTSRAEEDINETYCLGANAYITKPSNLHAFYEAVNQISNFWLSLSMLPPQRFN